MTRESLIFNEGSYMFNPMTKAPYALLTGTAEVSFSASEIYLEK